MATPAVQPRFVRTELVVRQHDGKPTPRLVQSPNNSKLLKVKNCSSVAMTEQEAEIFFAICENPSAAPIEMFAQFNEVSKWFND